MANNSNKIFNKTRIQFNELFQDAYTFFSTKYGQALKVFSLASAYGQILNAVAQIAELVMYYVEDSVTEANIETASRTDSIRGLARLTGHDPVRSIAATGELSMAWNGTDPGIGGGSIVVPNFTSMLCLNNGLPYVLDLPQEEVRVKMTSGRPAASVRIVQGEIQSQTFTGTGDQLQSFEVNMQAGRMIDQFFYNVYVNGARWQVYDSLYDMPKDAQGVLVKTGIGSGIDVIFGNGYFGAIPALGATIRVEYLINDGDGGNVREGNGISFEFQDSGYDTLGNPVDLNAVLSVVTTQPITFGTGAEPLYMTQLMAPNTSRSFVLARDVNYVYFLEKLNYFSQVQAYNTFDDDYLDDDNVIYLFLVPDITKRISASENYFTVPVQYFTLSDAEKQKVSDLLEASGSEVLTAVSKIVDPIIKKYVCNVSLVVYSGYSTDLIEQTVVDKMSTYLLGIRRRDRIPKSDLISIIEGIAGVDSVALFFLSQDNEAAILAGTSDPTVDGDIGLDEYGDVIIGRDELPLVRGGWSDRNGIFFADAVGGAAPGSINIEIRDVVQEDYAAVLNRMNVQNISNS